MELCNFPHQPWPLGEFAFLCGFYLDWPWLVGKSGIGEGRNGMGTQWGFMTAWELKISSRKFDLFLHNLRDHSNSHDTRMV